MEDWQERFFYTRSRQSVHGATIANAHLSKSKPDNQFRRVCSRVFSLHAFERPLAEPPQWPDDEEFRHYDLPAALADWIGYEFHANHYRLPPHLRKGLAIDGDRLSTEEVFFDRLRTRVLNGQHNKVSFLIGDIGSGKSTLISNIIAKYGMDWIKNHDIVPLRVDFDKKLNHELPEDRKGRIQLLAHVYDSVLGTYRKLSLIEQSDYARIAEASGLDIRSRYREVIAGLNTLFRELASVTGKTTLLMIDNFDFLYHVYDRALFVEEAAGSRHSPAQRELLQGREKTHELIQCIIGSFFDDEDCLAMAGCNVLIILRADSLLHFLANRRERSGLDPRDHTYCMPSPSVWGVLQSHLALMNAVFERWPVKSLRETYSKAIKEIDPTTKQGLKRSAQLLHADLSALSRQWLRQIVDHYGKYVWLPVSIESKGESQVVTTRFHEQYSPGIISFIQKGNRLFTQFESEFVNMYLIRGEKRQERNPAWSNLCRRHKHTYWLKRLIVEYVYQRKLNGEAVLPSSVYEVFVAHGPRDKAYEDWIVRLCLGSLSQVENCRVIDCQFAESSILDEISEITLTERGWRLMGRIESGLKPAPNVFVDTFTYMQIIVDDHLLPIPRSVSRDFHYSRGADYGYLAAPYAEYGLEVGKMIKRKIRQVFQFVDVLRFSFECEKLVFSDAMERLAEQISIPDIQDIEMSIRKSIEPLEMHIRQRFDPSFDYRQFIPDPGGYRESLQEEVRKIYGLSGKSK